MKWLYVFVLLLAGCSNEGRFRGVIAEVGQEKEAIYHCNRFDRGWRVHTYNYTDVKLKDGRNLRFYATLGEVGEEIIVPAPKLPKN